MPAYSTYYLNGPSLDSATAVFTDAELTICAPDGYYSDGVTARQQVGCSLLPAEICPSCGADCGQVFVKKLGPLGVYQIAVNLGNTISSTGAVYIKMNLGDAALGLMFDYDGVIYNTFSSQTQGRLTAPLNQANYVGVVDCGLAGNSFDLDLYRYSQAISDFGLTGDTYSFSVSASQLNITPTNPSNMFFVIPKIDATPSTLNITVFGACASPDFEIEVGCPSVLPPFIGSQVRTTSSSACEYPDNITYYSAPVNGNGVTLGLYDWIFLDQSGQFIAPDGYYYAPTACPMPWDWFRVKDGVIIAFGECSVANFILTRCADGFTVTADSLVPSVAVGDFVTIENPLYGGCVFEVTATSLLPNTEMIDSITAYTSCSDVCVSYSVYNSDGVNAHSVSYTDCNGTPQSISVSANNTEYICARVGSASGDPALIIEFDSCSC
jgi:hypothetical protein